MIGHIYQIPLKSFANIYMGNRQSKVKFWFYGIIGFLIIILFLPWTQNIKTKGNITSLYQEQRPQDINSPIPGKITKWFVKEGDYVKKGDTIVQLGEIKEDYLDPSLIKRTNEQLDAKKGTLDFYEGKILAAGDQITALLNSRGLKIDLLNNKRKQLDNKINGEKAELLAAENEYHLAKDQYERQLKMFEDGLVSQTQLQQRNVAAQNALAKKTMVENKLAQTNQEFFNIKIEQSNVLQEYAEKISKTESDRFQSQSALAGSQGDVAKLENQLMNYTIRNGMYILLAPQNGQIVQAKKAGLGEILKEGEQIAIIVPDKMNYAVEMFVRPVDLPLVNVGQKVRFMFDGFPAIVFSGWPKNSFGTFGGKIVAYENTISSNGMFRVLVAEDKTDRAWPTQLKMGSGAQGITLLKDVPIWYELWRNINGFPPDYYQIKSPIEKTK
ncbi:MAG: HlyD family efflux transporter periplasmic adaptor subunit [bacterium]|nr:HlyD family efflux transporter periplasmic adaptor subunit [bacterium]